MKRNLFLHSIVSLSLLSCLAHAADPFTFLMPNLSSEAALQKNFSFQMIDLRQVQQNKIIFSNHTLQSQETEEAVNQWQADLLSLQETAKDGIEFKTKTIPVDISKKLLKATISILENIDKTEQDKAVRLIKKIEVLESFNENFRESIDRSYDLVFWFSKNGKAKNISAIAKTPVKSKIVSDSSVWQDRSSAKVDMWNGPGTIDFEKVNQEVCDYEGPKTGYGIQPGFKIICGEQKLKAKFGNEIHSGPFNSRIYHRLGFNVPAIHFVPELKVRYSRRLLTEINSRKRKFHHIYAAGFKIADLGDNHDKDALDYVQFAVLKDGKKISNAELRENIFPSCSGLSCAKKEENFASDFEDKIDYLAFIPGSITEESGRDIGRWDFDTVDHADRTEIKSMFILGAWTGNYDIRKDNNRLVWVGDKGEVRHFISDPGSALGGANGNNNSSGIINNLAWQVVASTNSSVQVTGYKGKPNQAFAKMDYNDARWMVEQIAKISEEELSDALVASGLNAAEYLLAKEKLVSIRQNLIEAFDLTEKYKSTFRSINKQISFDPQKEKVSIELSSGKKVILPSAGLSLVDGVLFYPKK